MSRVGTWLLCAGGLVLAALMVYTLAMDVPGLATWPTWGGPPRVTEVAVFFPNQADWGDFRRGTQACLDRGLARRIEDTGGALVLETPKRKRRIRFALHEVRGVQMTKESVRRLAAEARPPIALVGSSNTVLTVALAEALRDSAGAEGGKGPVLLVPWASSVLVDSPDPAQGPVHLLGIDPGRTFRFCPNNQSQADLVVRGLLDQDPKRTPARAFILEDRHDAYSADLAESFRRAINRMAPKAVVIQVPDALTFSGVSPPYSAPSPEELALAKKIWDRASAPPGDQTSWVVLPVQGDLARRMIAALRAKAPPRLGSGDGPLRVVVGDGIGLPSLSDLAGMVPFPVWCVSPASLPDAGKGAGAIPSHDAQIPAEIVSALVRLLDSSRALDATGLRDGLAAMRIPADDRGAMGRPLDFSRSGEREGLGLGHIMFILPAKVEVYAMAREASGRWSPPVPVRPEMTANVP